MKSLLRAFPPHEPGTAGMEYALPALRIAISGTALLTASTDFVSDCGRITGQTATGS